jgi:hypothetical protein
MPKNQVTDLITDQEIAFAHLILSGTMTDRRAAEAVGLNPETAAYTKAKPRVREYMVEHRAAVHERIVQQEADEVRRLNLVREQVLTRLWEIANMDPERTRNSMSAQMKAVSTIVAIEGLIPDRRVSSAQNKPASPLVHPQMDIAARLREQQGETTVPHPSPDPDEDAPSHLGPTPGPDFDLSDSPSETIPSAPQVRVPDSAPGNRVTSSEQKKPDTLRLRL